MRARTCQSCALLGLQHLTHSRHSIFVEWKPASAHWDSVGTFSYLHRTFMYEWIIPTYNLGCPFMIPFIWSWNTPQLVSGRSSPHSSSPLVLLFSFTPLSSLSSFLQWLVWLYLTLERIHGDADLQGQLLGLPRQCPQRLCMQTHSLPALPPGTCSVFSQPLWAFTSQHYEGGWLAYFLLTQGRFACWKIIQWVPNAPFYFYLRF